MCERVKLTPLTAEEKAFAEQNHSVLVWYLNTNKLDKSEFYDVAAMGYLQAVKKWFARPELHKWAFSTIAGQSMRRHIGHERQRQNRLPTLSLDDVVPGTDDLTYGDIVTYENLDMLYGGYEMNISYNVKIPERKRFGEKSDEVKAFESFMDSKMKNMCIEYDTDEEAKKRAAILQTYRRSLPNKDDFEVFKQEKSIYVVRKPGRK